MLNVHLSTLARRHPHTKFLKGLASELDYFSDSSQQPSPSHLTAPDGYSFHPGIAIPTLTPSPSRLSFSTVSSGFSSATTGGASAGGDPFADEPRRSSNPFSEAGRSNRRRRATDSDVLPTILWYRGGEFVKSLHAIERDLPDGELKRGEEGCREVQELLSRRVVLSLVEHTHKTLTSMQPWPDQHVRQRDDGQRPAPRSPPARRVRFGFRMSRLFPLQLQLKIASVDDEERLLQ